MAVTTVCFPFSFGLRTNPQILRSDPNERARKHYTESHISVHQDFATNTKTSSLCFPLIALYETEIRLLLVISGWVQMMDYSVISLKKSMFFQLWLPLLFLKQHS